MVLLFYLSIALLFILLLGTYFWMQTLENTGNQLASTISLRHGINEHKREVLYTPKGVELSPRERSICLVSGSISGGGKERKYASATLSGREYATLSRKRLERYASIHGYSFKYFTTYYDSSAPAIWQKVYAVQEALEEGYDVVVWVDDDIWITDLDTPIEKFLSMSEKPLIFSEDMGGPSHNFINTGLYILRNTPTSRKFIEETIAGRLSLYSGIWSKIHFFEQSVMTYLIMNHYREETIVLKKDILQSFTMDSSWKPGDFCMHLAGEPLEERNKVFQELAKKGI